MNDELERLAAEVHLNDHSNELLRLAFGLACAIRVKHLLENEKAKVCLSVLQSFVDGNSDQDTLAEARELISSVANSHRGSPSIDGSAHAAVSATYAVANALAGRAIEAANYAAYASVYAYGGYAVTDPSAFQEVFTWQVEKLRELSRQFSSR